MRALSRIVHTEGGRNPGIANSAFENGHEDGYRQLSTCPSGIAPGLIDAPAVSLAPMFLTMPLGDACDRPLAGATVQRGPADLNAQIAVSPDWLVRRLCAQGCTARAPPKADGPGSYARRPPIEPPMRRRRSPRGRHPTEGADFSPAN